MKRYTAELLSEVTGLLLTGATLQVVVPKTNTRVTVYAGDDVNGPTVQQPIPNLTAFYVPDGRYDLLATGPRSTKRVPDVDLFDGFEQNRRLEALENGEPGAVGSLRADLLASSGAALVSTTQGLTVQATLDGLPLSPEMYGAKGDGITNDTLAFQRLALAVNALKGGAITFGKNKTYIIGLQTFAGANGKGYAYNYNKVLHITGCTKPTIIDMNGSTMKFADGLKFGAFDPVTGLKVPTVAPNPNVHQQAHPGIAIRADYNTGRTRIFNGAIDGNSPNLDVGGQYGDVGWQVVQYPIYDNCNDDFRCDVAVFNSGLDGICSGFTGMTSNTPPKPSSLGNSVIRNCGRNNVSVIGGNMFSTDDGFLSAFAGMAPNIGQPNGNITSAPAACIDFEEEQSFLAYVTLRGQLIAGLLTNTCLVADSGNSSDMRILVSLMAGVVWANKPRMQFLENRIAGVFRKLYGGQGAPGDNTLIRNLQGGDGPIYGAPQQTGLFMDMVGAGAGVRLEGINITLQATKFDGRNATSAGRNSIAFVGGTERFTDGDYLALMDFHDGQNAEWIFTDAITNKPANAYLILSPEAQFGKAKIVSGGNNIRWGALSGTSGDYPYPFSRLQTDISTWGALNGTASKAAYATYDAPAYAAAPTAADMQALANAVQAMSRRYKAFEDTARAKRIPR